MNRIEQVKLKLTIGDVNFALYSSFRKDSDHMCLVKNQLLQLIADLIDPKPNTLSIVRATVVGLRTTDG